MDSTHLLVVAVVAVAVLGVAWFAVRFWLASTRPADIKDVQTPALDRLNRRALEQAAARDDENSEEDDMLEINDDEEDEKEDAVPQGLRDAVADEKRA